MPNKKTFILGSGSSIGHSHGQFPSIVDFFSCAYELKLYNKESFKEIGYFTKQLLGKNIFTKSIKLDVESLFTLIEIEIERNPNPKLLFIRDELLLLIRKVLTVLEENIENDANIDNSEYDSLLKIIDNKDSIITFNWDTLLDNKLGRKELLGKKHSNVNNDENNGEWKPRTDQYKKFIDEISAFSGSTWKGLSVEEPYETWSSENGYYIKAHGSIDWYYCANNSCRAFRKVFPVQSPLTHFFCSECHEKLSCLIIPPVLNKGYKNYPMIRKIWNIAAKEISTSSELVIWGYSLPPTDFHANWLIRQARKGNLNAISIINPEVVNIKEGKSPQLRFGFIRKFYDLFRDILTKEKVFLFENFSDYKKKLDVIKKYPSLPLSSKQLKTL